MTDTVNKKPLRVSTESSGGPCIRLPLSQVDDVRRLLEGHGITYYWVDEDSLSWDGGPFMTYINFGHNGDAVLVQSVLDTVP
jgi:hypothetical protein